MKVKELFESRPVRFVKKHRWLILQVGVMLLPAALGYANEASSIKITPLQKPLEVLHDTLTGPLPAIATGMSAAMGGMSYAYGWEQHITQRCLKGVGGGAIAMGSGEFLDSLGIGVTGCLF